MIITEKQMVDEGADVPMVVNYVTKETAELKCRATTDGV
jgi:hypothetical protein